MEVCCYNDLFIYSGGTTWSMSGNNQKNLCGIRFYAMVAERVKWRIYECDMKWNLTSTVAMKLENTILNCTNMWKE